MLRLLTPLLTALALLALAAVPASAQSPSDVVELVCDVADGTPAPQLPVCPADAPGAPAPAPTEEEQDAATQQDADQHQHGDDPQAQAQEVGGETQTTVEKLADNPTNPGPAIDLVTFLIQWVLDHVVTAPLDLLKGAGLGIAAAFNASIEGIRGFGLGIADAWNAGVGAVASGVDAVGGAAAAAAVSVGDALGSSIDGIASAVEAAKQWVADLLAPPALPEVDLGDATLPVGAPELDSDLLKVPDVEGVVRSVA